MSVCRCACITVCRCASPPSLDVEHVEDHPEVPDLLSRQLTAHVIRKLVPALDLALVEALGQSQQVVTLLLALQPVLVGDLLLQDLGLLAHLLLALGTPHTIRLDYIILD